MRPELPSERNCCWAAIFTSPPGARARRTHAPSPRSLRGEGEEWLLPGKHLRHMFPIDEMVHERLEVVRPAVAIIDVVGVLPDVAAQDGPRAMHQRVLAVRRLGDRDLAILDGKPTPARAELGDAGLDEVLLHLRDRAEVGDDLLFKFARNLVAAATALHPLPEMDVIVMLTRIVEEAGILAERAPDDVLERLAVPLGSLEQIVAVIDIGEVMLVVMIFERFARHVRRERIVRIRQVGQGK